MSGWRLLCFINFETKTGTKWDLGHTREIPWEMVWSKSARYSLFNGMSLVLFFTSSEVFSKYIMKSMRILCTCSVVGLSWCYHHVRKPISSTSRHGRLYPSHIPYSRVLSKENTPIYHLIFKPTNVPRDKKCPQTSASPRPAEAARRATSNATTPSSNRATQATAHHTLLSPKPARGGSSSASRIRRSWSTIVCAKSRCGLWKSGSD